MQIVARIPLIVTLALLSSAHLRAQQFVRTTTNVPNSSGSTTEQIDFADVDLDGDWDAAFANGGDAGPEQNRLWINSGFAQGGIVGGFIDETASRFPSLSLSARDVEFADIDSDVDLYVMTHSQIVNQSARFWVNQGGVQGGSFGYFVDESASRWIGIAGPGSSFPQAVKLADGFITWGNDGDFADIDNDGDLDLVHGPLGPNLQGREPLRMFLNDGAGRFTEFNPGGAQLSSFQILDGTPALWCEGVQQANTTNTTGQFCDINNSTVGVEIGDVDGDFDLDLVDDALIEHPRYFLNRTVESGTLAWRDTTSIVFPNGYSVGDGHYEEALADFDGDSDLDLYGVNWQRLAFNFNDVMLRNQGDGTFGEMIVVPNSAPDDEDADEIDFDLDGDLDLLIANYSGQERAVRNVGAWSFVAANGTLPSDITTTRDLDVADVDHDGDPDAIVANELSAPEWLLTNTTTGDDSFAPRVTKLEQAQDRSPSSAPTIVRAHVYDNQPTYNVWYDEVLLVVDVAGVALLELPMRASRGQVFRAEIPGELVGTINYRVIAVDPYGNTGASVVQSYVSAASGTPFCFGDGSGTACPCSAGTSGLQAGCPNSVGREGRLFTSGTASVANDGLVLTATKLPESSTLFFQGTLALNGGNGVVFGDGLRCIGGTIVRLGTRTVQGGSASYPSLAAAPISVRGAIPAGGGTRVYQAWYRNVASFCTSAPFNFTNGVSVVWTP